MKTTGLLAAVLGLCTGACIGLQAGLARAALPYAAIYARATNNFAGADFFKPAEAKTTDLTFLLAPLILQQVNGTTGAVARAGRFGALGLSNGVPAVDPSRPTVYWQADTVQLAGTGHLRFSYVWCYSPPGAAKLSPGQAASGPAWQGIRITLNSAGQPVLWEVLADRSGARLIFVSRSLETAALAQFGQPLPGRRYAIERRVEEAPDVIVPRVIDDGPVAMGPIVYLSADARTVSTLICRCMPAQVRKLLASGTYELRPFQSGPAASLLTQARALFKEPTAFWPGEYPGAERLEKCLRLPAAFSGS